MGTGTGPREGSRQGARLEEVAEGTEVGGNHPVLPPGHWRKASLRTESVGRASKGREKRATGLPRQAVRESGGKGNRYRTLKSGREVQHLPSSSKLTHPGLSELKRSILPIALKSPSTNI